MSVIHGMPDVEYHARPELSASGARIILQAPARYRWAMDNPHPATPTFNLGHAVHSLVLGAGRPVAMLEHDGYTTKAAREERDLHLAAGRIPLTRPESAQVRAMADAVLSHPLAAALLATGEPEVSVFTTDPETGAPLRTRPDWIAPTHLVDLKTTINADPGEFGRTAHTFGYHAQARWYLDQCAAEGITPDDARLLFVLVEKEPPHLVSVVELDAASLRVGAERNRRAIDTYAHCLATDTWPGYPTHEAPIVSLPSWAFRQHEEDYA